MASLEAWILAPTGLESPGQRTYLYLLVLKLEYTLKFNVIAIFSVSVFIGRSLLEKQFVTTILREAPLQHTTPIYELNNATWDVLTWIRCVFNSLVETNTPPSRRRRPFSKIDIIFDVPWIDVIPLSERHFFK